MGYVRNDRALFGKNRLFRSVYVVNAEILHIPFFLGRRVVSASGEASGVAARLGKPCLPPSNDARDRGLGDFEPAFVIPAGLRIDYRALAPLVVMEGVKELGGRPLHVNVLAARYARRGSPSVRKEIDRDGRGKITGVRE